MPKETLFMIHYTCDCCKRIIDASEDTRYVVRMEVYMPVDATDVTLDDDRDHLDEIQDILERIDAGDEARRSNISISVRTSGVRRTDCQSVRR
jgi:hypothetical protein